MAYEDGQVLQDVFNPAELLVREAGARFGLLGGARELGGGRDAPFSLAPDFETGVNGDGNDTDVMLWDEDSWDDPLRFWLEDA